MTGAVLAVSRTAAAPETAFSPADEAPGRTPLVYAKDALKQGSLARWVDPADHLSAQGHVGEHDIRVHRCGRG